MRAEVVKSIREPKSGIVRKDGKFFATLDGKHTAPVQDDLGQNIEVALRVQDKIDIAIAANNRPGLRKMVDMLNCRKSVSAIRGTRSLRTLTHRPDIKQKGLPFEMKIQLAEEMSGVPEMMEDVDRILKSGRLPVLGTRGNLNIRRYLQNNPADLPATVHVFDIPNELVKEMVTKLENNPESFSLEDCEKLGRNHTLLVLNTDETGRYVCFQKRGPEVTDRFEVSELRMALKAAVAPPDSGFHVSIIGPATFQKISRRRSSNP